MRKVGETVIVTKYLTPYIGTVKYVKGFDMEQKWYIVEINGTIDHYKEEELTDFE